ncbi:hypothetical protein [Nonomuraea gerenzanensis]|uniref:hypothetical protein n=1 Tax=Nonomuraea gerenzanensis TaxID=93944 RepID=UPI001CD9C6FF|nr:hypothetical protein [Nonomuraea gerenzanensis]UBU16710.1 hypothetical protein LCN96_17325 [Nonomuraea gerenzanensis]
MRMLSRMELVAAWLAVVWAAAPLAPVAGSGLAVTVPLVVVAVGAVLEELERHGAGAVGIVLTAVAVWMLAVATWGVLGGSALVLSAAVALVVGGAAQAD